MEVFCRNITDEFRLDIQALRGISVLLVVLYHIGVPIEGGFVGVDIFFAISGFVVSGVMCSWRVLRISTQSFAKGKSRSSREFRSKKSDIRLVNPISLIISF